MICKIFLSHPRIGTTCLCSLPLPVSITETSWWHLHGENYFKACLGNRAAWIGVCGNSPQDPWGNGTLGGRGGGHFFSLSLCTAVLAGKMKVNQESLGGRVIPCLRFDAPSIWQNGATVSLHCLLLLNKCTFVQPIRLNRGWSNAARLYASSGIMNEPRWTCGSVHWS